MSLGEPMAHSRPTFSEREAVELSKVSADAEDKNSNTTLPVRNSTRKRSPISSTSSRYTAVRNELETLNTPLEPYESETKYQLSRGDSWGAPYAGPNLSPQSQSAQRLFSQTSRTNLGSGSKIYLMIIIYLGFVFEESAE